MIVLVGPNQLIYHPCISVRSLENLWKTKPFVLSYGHFLYFLILFLLKYSFLLFWIVKVREFRIDLAPTKSISKQACFWFVFFFKQGIMYLWLALLKLNTNLRRFYLDYNWLLFKTWLSFLKKINLVYSA